MAARPTLVDQVREELRALIGDGTFAPGDRLPNEQEIGERFSVSRATVREAYRALIDSGYLVSRRGLGTFVAHGVNQHSLDLNLSYVEMIRSAGFTPSVVVLSVSEREADPDERERLVLNEGDQVVEVERLRLADDRPVVYSVDRVASHLVPDSERGTGFGRSMFDLLERLARGARNGRTRLTPVLATPRIAHHLTVAAGAPLLHFDQLDYDEAGRAVMASAEWHTSDVFEMWINRRAFPPRAT